MVHLTLDDSLRPLSKINWPGLLRSAIPQGQHLVWDSKLSELNDIVGELGYTPLRKSVEGMFNVSYIRI